MPSNALEHFEGLIHVKVRSPMIKWKNYAFVKGFCTLKLGQFKGLNIMGITSLNLNQ